MRTSGRILLQRVTRKAHESLHLHTDFAAAAAGAILPEQYRGLLGKLFGFHAAIETCLGCPSHRSERLRQDLRFLGAEDGEIDRLPLCNHPPHASSAERLGVRYVVEGSALGGRLIARALDPLLGPGCDGGRRFFLGTPSAAGVEWRAFVTELDATLIDRASRRDASISALATFRLFQDWFGS